MLPLVLVASLGFLFVEGWHDRFLDVRGGVGAVCLNLGMTLCVSALCCELCACAGVGSGRAVTRG